MMHRLTMLVSPLVLVTTIAAQDWPAFRGPAGDGNAPPQSAEIPIEWDAKKNVRWKVSLPQPANGSPIISNGRVFLTCAEDKAGKQRSLYCFDRANGKRLWARTVQHDKRMPTHNTNPYGGTTPAADGKRVVVWHASAGLHCYDFDGKPLWDRDLGEFKHEWGYGTSPVIYEDMVLLHTGPGQHVFVTALELDTGKTIWRTDEPVQGNGQRNDEKRLMGSWCTPLVTKINGKTQILCTMARRLVAYAPEDGKILWTCEGLPCKNGDLAYSSPSIAGDVCLIVGGFDGPEIGIALKNNKGDVTKTRRLWRHPRRPSNCGSGVVVDNHLYIPDMRGIINCVVPKTGKRIWSERPVKGAIWSSIIRVGEHLLVTNQSGTTIVFRPGPKKLEVVAMNTIAEKTNSTPAVSNGEVFLRTHESLYCVGGGKLKR